MPKIKMLIINMKSTQRKIKNTNLFLRRQIDPNTSLDMDKSNNYLT